MATPFENWFSSDFRKMLIDCPDDRDVLSSGFSIATASWDRRAAYLLWVMLDRPPAKWTTIYPITPKEPGLIIGPPPTFSPIDEIEELLAGPAPAAKPSDDIEDLLA